jgi:hypothetical protein
MENTKNRKQRIANLRRALIDKYGARKYKITGTAYAESVIIYGQMPNSVVIGWWLMGDLDGAELWLGL